MQKVSNLGLSAELILTYPMSLPGSQVVSMPICPKLWALEGYIQTHGQTVLLLYRLALGVTSGLFRPALQDYSVALLPRVSRSHSRSLRFLGLCTSHSHSQSLLSLRLHACIFMLTFSVALLSRASSFILAVSVASLSRATRFTLAFLVASLPKASCLTLAFSVASLHQASRSHLARENIYFKKSVF